ncbi:hypothetical protein [Methanospirillum purgamenti]|nr:hypothetical protein [Methanospirillum sp. J.3.6.1-F.2.7.3]
MSTTATMAAVTTKTDSHQIPDFKKMSWGGVSTGNGTSGKCVPS